MPTYTVQFRPSDTGLALTLALFQKLSDGTAPTNPSPTFTEIGYGMYKFNYTAAEEVVFAIDGGSALPADTRYARGILSPQDAAQLTNLDVTVSSRASQSSVSGLPASVASATLDELLASHSVAGSLGAVVADIQSKAKDARQVLVGRWAIVNFQLVFYDADNTTPLFTFNLKDLQGNPTNTRVYERSPA